MSIGHPHSTLCQFAMALALAGAVGCQSLAIRGQDPGFDDGETCASLPTEKDMTSLPAYTIEPPDVLCIGLIGNEETPLAKQVVGEHLVAPDGTVNLGSCGTVYLTGMTIEEGRAAVQAHLCQFIPNAQVSLEVAAYNSKVYYVVVDRVGFGQSVLRLAATGNETVLDAVAQVPGLCGLEKKRIWIARPGGPNCCQYQILPIDWCQITSLGGSCTNYQVLPGDRVFIADESWCRPLQHLFGSHPVVH